jgi:hypothetical protein
MSVASNLVCSQCKLLFNLKNREPISLYCCSNTACRDCIQRDMIKSETKDIVKKGQFECAFCQSDHCAQRGFDQPMELVPNFYVR